MKFFKPRALPTQDDTEETLPESSLMAEQTPPIGEEKEQTPDAGREMEPPVLAEISQSPAAEEEPVRHRPRFRDFFRIRRIRQILKIKPQTAAPEEALFQDEANPEIPSNASDQDAAEGSPDSSVLEAAAEAPEAPAETVETEAVSDAGAESLGDREDTDSGEAPLVVEDPLFSSTTKGDEAEKTENHEKRGGFAGFLSIKRISVKAKEAGAPQGGKRKTIRTILILAVLLSGVAGFLLFGPDLDLTFNLPSVSEQRLKELEARGESAFYEKVAVPLPGGEIAQNEEQGKDQEKKEQTQTLAAVTFFPADWDTSAEIKSVPGGNGRCAIVMEACSPKRDAVLFYQSIQFHGTSPASSGLIQYDGDYNEKTLESYRIPFHTTEAYLEEYVVQRHPNATNLEKIDNKEFGRVSWESDSLDIKTWWSEKASELEKAFSEANKVNGEMQSPMLDYVYQSSGLTGAYIQPVMATYQFEEAGVMYQETVFATITAFAAPSRSILPGVGGVLYGELNWSVTDLFSYVAKAEVYDHYRNAYDVFMANTALDPEWAEANQSFSIPADVSGQTAGAVGEGKGGAKEEDETEEGKDTEEEPEEETDPLPKTTEELILALRKEMISGPVYQLSKEGATFQAAAPLGYALQNEKENILCIKEKVKSQGWSKMKTVR